MDDLLGPRRHLELIEAALPDGTPRPRSIAHILQQALIVRTPHKLDSSGIPITKRYLERIGLTPKMLEETGLFNMIPCDPAKHISNGCKLAEDINFNIMDIPASEEINILTGKPRRKPTFAIRSRADDGRKATYRNENIPTEVPIDEVALKRLVNDPTATTRERAHANLLLATSVNGKVTQEYRQGLSGRFFGVGNAIQYAPRRTRRTALQAREVDLQNAHPTIAARWAKWFGVEAPVIQTYVSDPVAFRSQIAEALNISTDPAKKLLLAATFYASPNGELAKIIREAGGEPTEIWNTQIKAYQAEIRAIAKRLIEVSPRRNGCTINSLGKPMPITERPSKLLAHHLQGLESQALQAMLDVVEIPASLEHEGVSLLDDDIDLEELEAAVLAATGVKFKVTIKNFKESQ